jgi:hypothetical protein
MRVDGPGQNIHPTVQAPARVANAEINQPTPAHTSPLVARGPNSVWRSCGIACPAAPALPAAGFLLDQLFSCLVLLSHFHLICTRIITPCRLPLFFITRNLSIR